MRALNTLPVSIHTAPDEERLTAASSASCRGFSPCCTPSYDNNKRRGHSSYYESACSSFRRRRSCGGLYFYFDVGAL